MLNSLHIRTLWHRLNWLTRLAIEVSVVVAMLIAMFIVALRYVLLPGIEQYHSEITDSLASAIGHPVTIGSIKGDWQGLRPHFNVTDVRILDEQRQPALVLPNIDASVSWMSLLTAELRLDNLDIAKPELLVRRDAQGNLFVGDVAFSSQGSDNTLADWLLHQSRVVVRDALIVWMDEQRDAPPLVLQQVNLHIENLFSHHRFALRALPPNELATPLDVRGDFSGASFEDLKKWRGQIFTQLDYTDVTAWRPWLELPGKFSQGRGALRGWLSVENGKVTEITADLDLRDVVTQLGVDVPEMVLLNLRGRAAWQDVPSGIEISAEKLTMLLQNGIELQPTDFYFRATQAIGEQSSSGEIRVNLLQLEYLAGLAKFLPLEPGLRDRLDAYSPSGRVSNLNAQWQGVFGKPDSYKFKGQFENIAVHQVGKMPGFSGLTADVDGSDTQGRLNITSRRLVVDAPGILREALSFNILTGQVGWLSEQGELSINVDNVAVANDDLAGNLFGSYRTQAGTLGVLDLTASLTRADIRRAARYTPLIALNKEGSDWLNGAMLAGHTEDFRVRVKGNLSGFPLDGTEDPLLEIGGHARDVAMEFARDWARIENISGEFWIHGNKLEVKVPSATMAGVHLQNVDVTLPDVTSHDLALEINGEAVAGNDTFLQFIQQSPVRGYISGFTDGVRASGNGHLALFARIPLKGDQPVQVSGNFHVQHSDIDLGAGVPWLRNTSGVLAFTESGMQANGISSKILGGTASINVQTAKGGTVHATVRGRSNLDVLRKSEAHPLLNYFRGGAAWDADISVVNKSAQITINTDLQGISSTLPQPFAKDASEAMPLRFEKANVAAGQDLITARLGSLLSVRLERSEAGGEMAVKRGAINFDNRGNSGAQDQKPDDTKTRKRTRQKEGVWVTGKVPVLSVEGWGDVLGATGKAGSALPITGINLSVGKLIGYGQTVGALQINAAKRGDGLVAKLAGKALSGGVTWLPRGYKAGGKLSARLRSLHLAKDTQAKQSPSSLKPATQDKDKPADVLRPGAIPALEIAIESLEVKGNPAGRFELVGYPDGKDWRLRRLNITNPDGSLSGDGIWRAVRGGTQTEVNLQLALTDAGKTLARSGYPDSVKGGSGKLAVNLSWAGTPDKFDYATLNGTLKLDAGKGQFLKMEPGAGKLLSILSMQALPKHVTTLDFTDVFSKGFQFDNIIGEAAIKNGVMDTQEFHIYGSAAKVALKGSVDLNRETQNLNVKVFPAIGDSVALLAVFAINPAAGIAGLIADKLLGSPLDKLVSFEYNVDGTWSDPNVVKIGGSTAKEKK